MKKMYLYDTCALLNLQERAFQRPFFICDVTLQELENIKTSSHKDEHTKYQARNLLRLLKANMDRWNVLKPPLGTVTVKGTLDYSNDQKIALTAAYERLPLVTDDLALYMIASTYDGLKVLMTDELEFPQEEHYTGLTILEVNDERMEVFHNDLTVNTAQCRINQYVFLKGLGKTRLGYRWTGEEYVLVYGKPVDSLEFGRLTSKDMYQQAAIDSIMNNDVTAIAGPAGSGKSLLSLACAFDLIHRGRYDRVVILVNPAKAKGAVDTGFYPGTSEEKLMASFAGNMLCSKFGEYMGVARLMEEGKLRLISMSDIRGMEIGDREILYIPECQNTTIELLKLCLSRVSEGAKVIFEGDTETQVDSYAFTGARNGMKRAVEVLCGSPLFGFIELQQVYRSPLAAYIERM